MRLIRFMVERDEARAENERLREALNSAPLQRCDWSCRNGDEDCETCKWVAKYKPGERGSDGT